MENKKCIGRYVFEDMECMHCPDCSACQITKNSKEMEVKKQRAPKVCHDCIDLYYCRKLSPESCIGANDKYGQGVDCDRCKCRFECYNKCLRKVSVLCIKSVTCRIHDSSKFISFTAGEKYDMNIVGKQLHAKDRYDAFEKIFNDYNNEIIKNYFIIDIVE